MTTDELKYAELVCGSVYAESTIASVTHIIQYNIMPSLTGRASSWKTSGTGKAIPKVLLWETFGDSAQPGVIRGEQASDLHSNVRVS